MPMGDPTDELIRCPWAVSDPLHRSYHDEEWGRLVHGESAWFERLSLEAFQSGLSWITILRKRESFRSAFAGFDADTVARFDAADVDRLMSDPGIVRNRAKVLATINNAAAVIALRDTGGLEGLMLSHAPAVSPGAGQVTSPASVALARELRRLGFKFVGPTTMHALMEATGMFDPHTDDCFRKGQP